MANRDMKVSVLVQLVDRLTAPLRGLTRGIASVANSIGDLGRRIGIVGGALAALSFTAPLQQAAAWDAQLRDIAITAGKTGGAVEQSIAEMSKRYEKLAFDTGQGATNVAKGAQLLIASGMDAGLIDKLMPTIARVATATGATIEDTAKTVFSLSDALRVPSDQMEAMLGKLVVAGKLGRFEFKNMAAEFPSLTAQMAKFGITGAEAVEALGSSLQIAMLGTSSPSEAANNLKNFLTKINAPEAIKKFEKELKVDVTGVMTDAAAKGINPVEAVIQKMSEKLKVPTAEIDKIMKKAGQSNMTDKDKEKAIRGQVEQLLAGTKVGKLYSDMQVLDFLIPTLLNVEKLKDFKRQLKDAGVDVIADDFASQMRGLKPQMEQLSVLTTALGNRIGAAFGSNIPMMKDGMLTLLKGVSDIDKAWPGLIDGALSWAGALLVLGAGLAILTPVVSALVGLFGMLISPVVLAAAAIGAAAWHIWSNWERLGPEMGKIFGGLKEAAGGFGEMMSGLFTGDSERTIAGARQMMAGLTTALDGGWEVMKSLAKAGLGVVDSGISATARAIDRAFGTDVAGSYERLKTTAADAWEAIKAKGDELVTWAQGLPGRISTALGDAWTSVKQSAFDAWEAIKAKGDELVTWAQGLPGRISTALGDAWTSVKQSAFDAWEAIKAKGDELVTWAQGLPGRMIAAIGSIDLSNIIKWPALPKWLGGTAPSGPGEPGLSTMDGFNPTSAPAPAPGSGIGGSAGFTRTAGGPAANSNVNVGGRIVVEAAEGTRVVNVQSENPAVPVTPNRGTMLGRA